MIPPDITDPPVRIGQTGDYNVELDIDKLPAGTVAVDYYEDSPRLVLRDVDVAVSTEDRITTIELEPTDPTAQP